MFGVYMESYLECALLCLDEKYVGKLKKKKERIPKQKKTKRQIAAREETVERRLVE